MRGTNLPRGKGATGTSPLWKVDRRLWVGGIAVCVLIVPFSTEVVPAWSVQVLDAGGSPLPGVMVRQVWQHASIETELHSDRRVTDQHGRVLFPERRTSASILKRGVALFSTALRLNKPHANWGRASEVYAWRSGYRSGRLAYIPGETPPEMLILKAGSDLPP